MTRLSEQEVSRRRQRLAVATTQARALAREVHRLRAEILSGEASDGPDPRQLELPEVSPTPTPALAQAEPARLPTLLELAALQGLPVSVNGAPLTLAGKSRARWAERIGNAVPVGAARAIAGQMLRTLSAAASGDLHLSSTAIWV